MYSATSKSSYLISPSAKAFATRLLLSFIIEVFPSASTVPSNSHQDQHTFFKYSTANIPADLLLPMPESTLSTNLNSPGSKSSPSFSRTVLKNSIVGPRFKNGLRQEILRIYWKSTHMNAVRSLVRMTHKDCTSVFFGEELCSEGYE